ncbi:hypothetical protein D3C85_1864900 [compost metagenome]
MNTVRVSVWLTSILGTAVALTSMRSSSWTPVLEKETSVPLAITTCTRSRTAITWPSFSTVTL